MPCLRSYNEEGQSQTFGSCLLGLDPEALSGRKWESGSGIRIFLGGVLCMEEEAMAFLVQLHLS